MKTILAFAAIASALAASPALAQEPVAVAGGTIVIRTADLDLSRHRDVRGLDRRIRAAVKLACGTGSDVDVAGKNRIRQCRADTLASIAEQRDQAIALARAQSGARLAAK